MKNKIAVVSGATKGIGYSIAQTLVNDGFFVVGTYFSNYDADKIAALENDNFKLYQVNATDFDACKDFAKLVKEKYGSVYALVNNAGITKDNLLLRMDESDFKAVIDTNLVGVFNMSKAFLRDIMRAKEGSIVNVASVIGLIGNVGQSNYAAAKAGVIGFSKSLSKELASRNIRVNSVAPGFIQTDMTDILADSVKEDILSKIPLNKLGSTQDVANAVSFLVSDKSTYITGQTLNVCGGLVV